MSQTDRRNIKKIATIFSVILALILLLLYMQGAFVSKVPPGSSPQVNHSNPPTNDTAAVIKKQIDNILTWPGTVKSRTVANIAPKMTARIIEIKVNAGDAVKQGDLIARLDERDVKAREQIALATLAGANAEANRAKADEQRIRSLYSKEAATRENFDAVIARAKETQARVNQATSTVREVRTHLADTLLLAPFDGIVVKRLKQPGDMGLPGVPIVTMQLPKGLRLEVDVPSTCAGRYNIGMDVMVHIDTLGQKISAQINEISPEIDPQTHTQLIKIALPAIEGLKPGHFGWLEQACDQHEALLIPVSAVQHIGQLEIVQVLSEGRPQMRHIRTAKTFGDQIEVISGLHANETVITNPQRAQ
ncbi:MAG: efflux RND transporter periplasmic adaptor subunit [Nitrosomonas sp.]|uniref:efflux RND transporter periplasmic adaptor subunit n=1 Tax=Nitrosomonas sp. TaxID=42353 RepID=UPI002733ADA9|nr:efflux RND transporter periplasmic adaptor subunit [Nitrosomonas sp.]MDP3280244.1 efflux RND transporter periplasmic adaptor subunit [Nitrosomonas sp.]MDP3663401.1 efflux RND transporter periplasmic adaptor subunit [Nitrosomonas sp.]MDZ4105739.1 efflux RND transporter periplasmic adaptor subunit [Nitrosomonas sp.]